MLETHYVLPYIDPVLVSLGPLQIRWYSLAYIFGIIATILWLKHINKKTKFIIQKAYDSWISWAVLSIIIGGRLGYVLFYNFGHYLNNPLEILAFWHGGMSFHGGLIGAIFECFYFAENIKLTSWNLWILLPLLHQLACFLVELPILLIWSFMEDLLSQNLVLFSQVQEIILDTQANFMRRFLKAFYYLLFYFTAIRKQN